MKKLKKSSLDELAKKMPVVNAQESAKCIGGDYYFDSAGNYLGETNYNQDIFVTTQTFFNSYKGLPGYLAGNSYKPSDVLNNDALRNIAIQLKSEAGIPQTAIIGVGGSVVVEDSHSGSYYSLSSLGLIASYNNNNQLYISDQGTSFDSLGNLQYAFRYAQTSGYFSSGYFSSGHFGL